MFIKNKQPKNEPDFRGENVPSALWRWDFSDCHSTPWTNLDCGGKRRATPLFRTRTSHQLSTVIRKRRRRFALPAHHIAFASNVMIRNNPTFCGVTCHTQNEFAMRWQTLLAPIIGSDTAFPDAHPLLPLLSPFQSSSRKKGLFSPERTQFETAINHN
jgi:hypothetical protein